MKFISHMRDLWTDLGRHYQIWDGLGKTEVIDWVLILVRRWDCRKFPSGGGLNFQSVPNKEVLVLGLYYLSVQIWGQRRNWEWGMKRSQQSNINNGVIVFTPDVWLITEMCHQKRSIHMEKPVLPPFAYLLQYSWWINICFIRFSFEMVVTAFQLRHWKSYIKSSTHVHFYICIRYLLTERSVGATPP